MTLIEQIRTAVKNEELPVIFSAEDINKFGIPDPNNNISNYDKKNVGAKNKKVLVSRKIGGIQYYTFDEQIFDSD